MSPLVSTALAAAPGWIPLPAATPASPAPLGALATALPDTRTLGLAAPAGDPFGPALAAHAVLERRVRLVVFDAPVSDLEPVDRALQACTGGDAPVRPPALEGWDPAASAWLTWACTHNAAHPADPVHVAGAAPMLPWDAVRVLEREVLPALETEPERLLSGVRRCQGAASDSALAWQGALAGPTPPRPTLADDAACRAALDALDAAVGAGAALLEPRGLTTRARQALRGLRSFELQQVALRLDGDAYTAALELAEVTEEGLRRAAAAVPRESRVLWWASEAQVRKGAGPVGVGARQAARRDYAAVWVLPVAPAPPENAPAAPPERAWLATGAWTDPWDFGGVARAPAAEADVLVAGPPR